MDIEKKNLLRSNQFWPYVFVDFYDFDIYSMLRI